jgi:hypothetical protein
VEECANIWDAIVGHRASSPQASLRRDQAPPWRRVRLSAQGHLSDLHARPVARPCCGVFLLPVRANGAISASQSVMTAAPNLSRAHDNARAAVSNPGPSHLSKPAPRKAKSCGACAHCEEDHSTCASYGISWKETQETHWRQRMRERDAHQDQQGPTGTNRDQQGPTETNAGGEKGSPHEHREIA